MTKLPDGSGCFVDDIDTNMVQGDPVMWNPWNKVVQDHRDGTIHHEATNKLRLKRGLPVPWTPDIGEIELRQPPAE